MTAVWGLLRAKRLCSLTITQLLTRLSRSRRLDLSQRRMIRKMMRRAPVLNPVRGEEWTVSYGSAYQDVWAEAL